MKLWELLFGKKELPSSQPAIVTSMSSDDWLDWMLDELEEKDRRKECQPGYNPRG